MNINHQQRVIIPFNINTKTQNIVQHGTDLCSIHGRFLQNKWRTTANKLICYCVHCYLKSKVLWIFEIRGTNSGAAKAARLLVYNAVTLNNKP